MTFEEVIDKFDVKTKNGDQVQAICPCHADKKASLSLKKGAKGTLITCHAGCRKEDILDAAGLKMSDLFFDQKSDKPRVSEHQFWLEHNAERFDYLRLDNGNYDLTKWKKKNKRFEVGRYKDGVYQKSAGDVKKNPLSIYCNVSIDRLKEAIQKGETVCYAEGGHDVKTLAKFGYIALTCGAVGTFKEDILPWLKGGKFVLFADNDVSGIKDAKRVSSLLNKVAAVKMIIPPDVPDKGDISDYMLNHTAEDLNKLIEQTEQMTVRKEPLPEQVDLTQFHHFDSRGIPTSVFDYRVCEYIKEHYDLFVLNCVPYIYVSGVYQIDKQGTKLKSIIKTLVYDKFKKSRIINQVFNLLIEDEDLQIDADKLNSYPKQYVNLADCMVDLKSLKEIEHSPKYYAVNQIPWKWSEIKASTQGENINKFVKFAIPNIDDQQMLYEYGGYCLTADTGFQRFVLICGEGGTGKSIVIRLFQMMVGTVNTAAVPLQKLNERFAAASLYRKILNVCADLPLDAINDSSMLKQLLGEDSIMAEFKGKDIFEFSNYAKLIFSTNGLPNVTGERSNAFYRRVMILPMAQTVKENERDPHLIDKLKPEIPYFINRCVQAVHEAYKRGFFNRK